MSNRADQQFDNQRLIHLPEKGDKSRFSRDEGEYLYNFPMSLNELVGREQACMAASEMLLRPEVRMLTLTGTGGVGKTSLAIAVAANLPAVFTDGIYFVPLSSISDPALVISAIVQVLGIKEAGDISLFTSLKSFLHEKHMLLLLDNFEQIITAAPLLSELLFTCSQVKMLVTSRAVLRIQGEYEFVVSPLLLPDLNHLPAIEDLARWPVITLFMQRAQAVKPGFQMTKANAHDITAICARLDGLPLAIELAAARIKLLPPRALLLRLEHRLQILTSGRADMPARHQTLRDTIAWSYDLLDEQEQRLFRHLSVFAGGCSLSALEAICATLKDITIPVLDGVTSLLDKSLVLQIERGDDEPRLSLLETMREYGVERMVAHEELACTCNAHAHYYLELAEEADAASYGTDAAIWLERQELENDNFRAALRWLLEQKELELALRLTRALAQFWFLRGYLREGLQCNALRAEERDMSPQQVLASQPPLPAVQRDSLAAPDPVGLTRRELEVLRLVARGLTNAQIAEQLMISYATVNSYLRSIYSKMGVSSRTSAMRYAIDHHLI